MKTHIEEETRHIQAFHARLRTFRLQCLKMNLKFINPVVFVKDIHVSRAFYTETLRLKVIGDQGLFVLFEGHFSILQAEQWQRRQNLLLYFETGELEDLFMRLKDQVKLIHPIERQAWGQRVFRFYDPDGHVIEIGEPM